MRKRRTREHVIADLCAHHVEGFVLRCGWTVERTRHDYGRRPPLRFTFRLPMSWTRRRFAFSAGFGTNACDPPEGQFPMIAKSTVTFAELRQLLLELGFTQAKRGKFWFFEHAPSETILAYRPYRVRERVTLLDMHLTRQHLDWRGLLAPDAFDDLFKKATA